MSPVLQCPSQKQLSDYAFGRLGDEESQSVAQHVKSCQDCLARIDTVNDAPDTMVERLGQPVPDDAFLHEAECQKAVTQSAALARELISMACHLGVAQGEVVARELASMDSNVSDHQAGDPPNEGASNLGYIRDYHLIRELGHGGMGTVYEALHTQLDKLVAIKTLPEKRMRNPEAVKRFQREMKAIGKLDHPNIVRAHDAGEAGGKHFLVMEYVEGLDLSMVAKRVGPLSVADACELTRQAALGLQYAHDNQLVHRDVKPSNFMVTREGTVKLLDLGLALLHDAITDETESAKDDEELTFEGQVMGTLAYMAPEQLGDSHAVTRLSDIYSLGATLYRLLTGEPPYADKKYNTPTRKLVAIATKSVKPIQEFRDDVPEELIAVLDRMMAKDPDDRYQSASDVAEALVELSSDADLKALVTQPTEDSVVSESAKASKDSTNVAASPHAETLPDLFEPEPSQSFSARYRPQRSPKSWLKLTGLSLLFFLLVAGALTVFYIQSGDATLVVKVADTDVEAVVKEHGLVIRDLTNNRQWTIREEWERKVSEGEFILQVTDDAGLSLYTNRFTLKRGDREVVVVEIPRDTPIPEVVPPNPKVPEQPIPGPLVVKPGEPICKSAWVQMPAPISDVLSWTIVAREGILGYQAFSFSPDGKLLAVGSQDAIIRLREAETGRLVRVLVGHERDAANIMSLDWSPDGSVLASGSDDKTVRLWDAQSGRLLQTWHGHSGQIHGVAWSSNGATLASVGDKTLRFWDATTGQLLQTLPSDVELDAVDWTTTGGTVATKARDGTIEIWEWDGQSAQPVKRLQGDALSQWSASFVKWSPNGKLLASWAVGVYKKPMIWDVVAGKPLSVINVPEAMAWLPDGESVIAGTGVWDVKSGKQIRKIDGFPPYLHSVDLCPESGMIALQVTGNVELWDIESGQLRRLYQGHPTMTPWPWKTNDTLSWSTDSNFVYLVGMGDQFGSSALYSWNLQDRTMRRPSQQGYVKVRAVSNGEQLATTDHGNSIRILSANSGREVKSLSGHTNRINDIACSPDSRYLVSAGEDKTARLWDIQTATEIRVLQHDLPVYGVAYSATGDIIATADPQGIHLWDAKSGQRRVDMEVEGPKGLAFSDDAHSLAIIDHAGAIQLWDVPGGKRFDTINTQIHQPVALAWSGNRTLMTYGTDNTVQYWDTEPDIRRLRTRECPGVIVFGAAFSSDGSMLALEGIDVLTTVEAATGHSRAHVALRDGQFLTISEDGHYVGSPRVERLFVYVVQTERGQEMLTPDEFAAKYGWKNDPERVTLRTGRQVDGGSDSTVVTPDEPAPDTADSSAAETSDATSTTPSDRDTEKQTAVDISGAWHVVSATPALDVETHIITKFIANGHGA